MPQIVDDYCTGQVLCMTFERGVPINSPVMLSFGRKNAAMPWAKLQPAVRELFEWGEMQTDPNPGNPQSA